MRGHSTYWQETAIQENGRSLIAFEKELETLSPRSLLSALSAGGKSERTPDALAKNVDLAFKRYEALIERMGESIRGHSTFSSGCTAEERRVATNPFRVDLSSHVGWKADKGSQLFWRSGLKTKDPSADEHRMPSTFDARGSSEVDLF